MDRKVVFRLANKNDAAILAMKLRDQDYHELQAAHGIDVDVKAVLERAIDVSREAYVAECSKTGELILMFGVSIFNEKKNVGCPWLLGSDKTKTLARELLGFGKSYVSEWKKDYQGLINFVDARNTMSVRFLKKLGFMIHDPIEFGALKKQFHPFTMMGG